MILSNERWIPILLLATLGVSGCQTPPEENGDPPLTKVTVASPVVMPIVEWDEYTGRLEAIDSVEVRARVSGYLSSTHFQEGQLIKRGDLLAIIDPRPFEAELNGAQARLAESKARLAESQSLLKQAEAEKTDSDAQLNLANKRLDRAKRLAPTGAVPREEVDIRESEQLQAGAAIEAANAKVESAKAGIATASAAIATAEANVETAKLNLQYTRIRAPVSGRISRRYVTEGNLISGGTNQSTLLTTIVSTNPIHCYFDANEQAFLKYARLAKEGKRESSRDVKNPVRVALVDETGFPHSGHMDFVDNRIDPNTGTIRGRAILANEDGLLTPGLFVKVRLPGSGQYEAVMIPDSAVGSDQSEKFVYTIGDGNKIVRKNIQLGPLSHGLRIIRDGLEGDEKIVTRGLQRVFPEMQVATETVTLEAKDDPDLPDNYQPVLKEDWLTRQPAEIPDGIQQNDKPYDDVDDNPAEPLK